MEFRLALFAGDDWGNDCLTGSAELEIVLGFLLFNKMMPMVKAMVVKNNARKTLFLNIVFK